MTHPDSETEAAKPRPIRAYLLGERGFPALPVALTLLFIGFVLFPVVHANSTLAWTFVAVGAVLLSWQGVLAAKSKSLGLRLRIEFSRPLKSHYVQSSVQLCLYSYWGWYWPKVYESAPLILAQMLFLYLFDGLLSWTRGRAWRIGMGPVPIIFSTNLFLWFKDDWFIFQFVMIAACALGKEFIRWNRDGKSTHIFNPSAFGLALVSMVLIATGMTRLTWGIEVATTLGSPPHIYLVIFLLGLIVQYFFAVTLMTFSAVAALYVLNLIYTGSTGVYFFVDTNLPAAIFLGLHFLVTDPSTSPRTNAGRIVFGTLYGVANFALFEILGGYNVPDFYDKLLPVPILNLCVPWMDRLARSRVVTRMIGWEARFRQHSLNLVHMSCWSGLFVTMLTTGFVESAHPGSSIDFWRNAHEAGKPNAGRNYVKLLGTQADGGSASACNHLGAIYLEGELLAKDEVLAASYFLKACTLGNVRGCENLARQYLIDGAPAPPEMVTFLLAELERASGKQRGGRSSFLLGLSHESGRGRAPDLGRALDYYEQGAERGNLDASRALVRIRLAGDTRADELEPAVLALEQACAAGDAQSCFYLARLRHGGLGLARDDALASELLEQACKLGSAEACEALSQPDPWLDFSRPPSGG